MKTERNITSVQGTISRITYQHPDTHYTVARLEKTAGPRVTVVGVLFPVSEGEEIKVTGVWKTPSALRPAIPGRSLGKDRSGDHRRDREISWLRFDQRHRSDVCQAFGRCLRPRYLEGLSEEPLRILDVDGIGEVRARRIMQAWQAQRGMQDVMVFLQGHGVGASLALRIYRVYGADTIDTGQRKSLCAGAAGAWHRLFAGGPACRHIGIQRRFSTARASRRAACACESRRSAVIVICRWSALSRNAACRLLEVDEERVEDAVEKLAERGEVVLAEKPRSATSGAVYLPNLYRGRAARGRRLARLLTTPSFLQGDRRPRPWEKAHRRSARRYRSVER